MDKKLQIIDFEKKGNLVRFYLGKPGETEYHGDDWNDRPYEHNAGTVYDRYVEDYIDIVFPYEYEVMEPADDWRYHGNSPYCKDDFKERKAPCIVAVYNDDPYTWIDNAYSEYMADDKAVRIYFGDLMEPSFHTVLFERANEENMSFATFDIIRKNDH